MTKNQMEVQKKARKACQDLSDYYKADPKKWIQHRFGYYEIGMCPREGLAYFSGWYRAAGCRPSKNWDIYNEALIILNIPNIIKWNDDFCRTFEDVIERLEEAAKS